MKYISDTDRGWNHLPYWDYLESVKGIMPAKLFAFAAAPENHDLTSPNSLHDSWLRYCNIQEIYAPNDIQDRSIKIDISLLNPYHNGYIYLTYNNVREYNINKLPSSPSLPQKSHSDLLIHEMIIVGERLYSHELLFYSGASFLIQFEDFEHRIESF